MKNVSGFWFAAALRYLFVLIIPLGLIRVFGAVLPSPGLLSVAVFALVSVWAVVTTMARYRQRLAAPAQVDEHPQTVRLNR